MVCALSSVHAAQSSLSRPAAWRRSVLVPHATRRRDSEAHTSITYALICLRPSCPFTPLLNARRCRRELRRAMLVARTQVCALGTAVATSQCDAVLSQLAVLGRAERCVWHRALPCPPQAQARRMRLVRFVGRLCGPQKYASGKPNSWWRSLAAQVNVEWPQWNLKYQAWCPRLLSRSS